MSAPERLDEIFNDIWGEIRGARHIPGQPRNEASGKSVALATRALQLATESNDQKFLIEAWHMMAHSLMADEQYERAVPFYQQRVERLEALGDLSGANIAREGYVLALLHAGRYSEALDVGHIAKKWFEQRGNELHFARICTNLGNVFHRL